MDIEYLKYLLKNKFMKTISVIFTKEKQSVPKGRQYTCNTKSDVKVGDLIHIEESRGNQQVVKIHDKVYTKYASDGILFDEDNYKGFNIEGNIKEVICTVIK